MAVDTAPSILRKRNVAFKTETTTGTFITLAAADGVTPVFTEGNDEVIAPDFETVDREGQGSISAISAVFGGRSARTSFLTEAFNSGTGTNPIWASRLLPASGMTAGSGGVYSPNSAATATCSVGYYLPGQAIFSIGTMFTWTYRHHRAHPPRFKWDGLGVWDTPTTATLSTPTYVTTVAPRLASTLTIGAVTYRMPDVEIEFGNELILREDLTAVDSGGESTGYRAAMIVDRNTRVRVSPEATPLATLDWYNYHRNGTTVALSIVIGSGANNVITIACPKLQLMNPPGIENRNKLFAQRLEFRPIRNAAAGDDDITLTFS